MAVRKISLEKLLVCFLTVLLTFSASASMGYGDGSDGSLTISSNVVVNDYTYFTGDESSGSTNISVNDASEFSPSDEILIIQMQNGTGNGIAGRYEFKEVESTSPKTLTLKDAHRGRR